MSAVELVRVGISPKRRDLDNEELESPDVDQVAGYLARIDGLDYDQFFLEVIRDGSPVEIGLYGGSSDAVVLHIFDMTETYYPLGGEADDVSYSLITSGGSQIDVLTRWLVPPDTAARAVWFFLLSGTLDPGLKWDLLSEVDFNP